MIYHDHVRHAGSLDILAAWLKQADETRVLQIAYKCVMCTTNSYIWLWLAGLGSAVAGLLDARRARLNSRVGVADWAAQRSRQAFSGDSRGPLKSVSISVRNPINEIELKIIRRYCYNEGLVVELCAGMCSVKWSTLREDPAVSFPPLFCLKWLQYVMQLFKRK